MHPRGPCSGGDLLTPLSHLPQEKQQRARLWISGAATVGIALIVGLIYLGVALKRIDHARKVAEREHVHLIQQTDRKFAAALHASTIQTDYSINKSVCILRRIAKSQLARARKVKYKGYEAAITFWQSILDNQVPIPADLDCASLPKHPPVALPLP